MTYLTVVFAYDLPAGERAVQALSRLRQVYGVQKMSLNEQARTIRVEYDASRLTKHDINAAAARVGCGEDLSSFPLPGFDRGAKL
jgi:hypothetical protein